MRSPPTPREISAVRRAILRFYSARRRDLPWRRTRDPYRILVSEVMLQQTTVAAVVPYYERFLSRFPDPAALARAGEDEVLQTWSGLGYYARARNLQRACREIVGFHGGQVPASYEDLLALPGIGPYTAGAVASIAFGRAEPAMDGNVARVLARLGASSGRGAEERRRLLDMARALVDGERPGDLNQAFMELGATICTPRRPQCGVCVLSRWCRAARAGQPERFPFSAPRPAMQARRGVVLLIRHRGGVLLVQRPPRPPLAGLWELPGIGGVDHGSPDPTPVRVAGAAAGQLRRPVEVHERLGEVRHTVMNRRIRLEIRRGVLSRSGGAAPRRPPAAGGVPAILRAARPKRSVRPREGGMPALTAASRKALCELGLLRR